MPLDSPAAGPLHPRWSEHHRPVATGLMSATCRITRATGDGTIDGSGTWHPPASSTVYEGPCRALEDRNDQAIQISGDRQLTVRHYHVEILYDAAEVQVGDDVEILTAADTGMVGLRLRVADVTYSNEQWARVLRATETEQGE